MMFIFYIACIDVSVCMTVSLYKFRCTKYIGIYWRIFINTFTNWKKKYAELIINAKRMKQNIHFTCIFTTKNKNANRSPVQICQKFNKIWLCFFCIINIYICAVWLFVFIIPLFVSASFLFHQSHYNFGVTLFLLQHFFVCNNNFSIFRIGKKTFFSLLNSFWNCSFYCYFLFIFIFLFDFFFKFQMDVVH